MGIKGEPEMEHCYRNLCSAVALLATTAQKCEKMNEKRRISDALVEPMTIKSGTSFLSAFC
jgi:hypothetical protein